MRHTCVIGLAAALLAGCGGGSADLVQSGPDPRIYPLASGVAISKVAVLQGVEEELYALEGGSTSGSVPLPVIGNRDALLRVHVVPLEEWEPRELALSLTLRNGDEETYLDTRGSVPVDGSWMGDLATTFNIDLPGNLLQPGLELEISLRELSFAPRAGSQELAVWRSVDDPFQVAMADSLELHIIPVKYDADGSGRLPDLTEKQLKLLRETMYAMFPVSAVNLVVEDPLPWSQPLTSGGGGWDALLNRITDMRSLDDVPPNTYYYGLFTPAPSMGEFCGSGCTAGLSNLALSPGDDWARASIGLGFPGEGTAENMAHAVGHAHGRDHAPCGTFGDNGYPYSGAKLGSWGYDLVTGELKEPASHVDVMSYCSPVWVSDYTFEALLERVVALRQIGRSAESTFRRVLVRADGSLEWGGAAQVRGAPGGHLRTVDLLDADGVVVGTETGFFYPFDHSDGGFLLLPEPEPEVVDLAIR